MRRKKAQATALGGKRSMLEDQRKKCDQRKSRWKFQAKWKNNTHFELIDWFLYIKTSKYFWKNIIYIYWWQDLLVHFTHNIWSQYSAKVKMIFQKLDSHAQMILNKRKIYLLLHLSKLLSGNFQFDRSIKSLKIV